MSDKLEIGVITSLEPSPDEAFTRVRKLGVRTVQVTYPESLDNDIGVAMIKAALDKHGIDLASTICRFDGESYVDTASVRATVGLSPVATRAERLDHVTQVAAFGERLGVKRIQAPLGFVPTDPRSAAYQDLLATARALCHIAAKYRQEFAIETGITPPALLRRFINEVRRPNIHVTLDPANLIIYDNGKPSEAIDALLPFIDSVNCRDAKRPGTPGQLGLEVPLGEGEADVANCLEKIVALCFRGQVTVARLAAGIDSDPAILAAKALVESVLHKS